jgi:hypothetical protein
MNLTNPDSLRDLIKAVVRETLAEGQAERAALPEKVYTEAEAAAYLGVAPHVLRDARLRGTWPRRGSRAAGCGTRPTTCADTWLAAGCPRPPELNDPRRAT